MRKNLDGEARDRLVIWLRRRMAEFGITPEALEASIEADASLAPAYRDAMGNEWDGLGEMPTWLAAAKHAGVNPDFFRASREVQQANVATDPRQMAFLFEREA